MQSEGDRWSAQWCISQWPDSSNLRALKARRHKEWTDSTENSQTVFKALKKHVFEAVDSLDSLELGDLSSLPTMPSLLHRSFVLRRLFCIILGHDAMGHHWGVIGPGKARMILTQMNQMQSVTWFWVTWFECWTSVTSITHRRQWVKLKRQKA